MSYIYVASPYSHKNPDVVFDRFQDVSKYTADLLRRKIWCYSPIVHCHYLAEEYELPTDYAYWMDYNKAMMNSAKAFQVLRLPGWEESKGVTAEIAYWLANKASHVEYIEWRP